MSYVGRLAPSPTGAQHLGNARTFLVTWLACRLAQGRLLLRIEDLDTPRTKPGAIQQAMDDLRWLGLDWDSDENPSALGTFLLQSERENRYAEVLAQLQEKNLVYPCSCTRSEVESAASAPHESILDGVVYSGHCSNRNPSDAKGLLDQGIAFAWRFRFREGFLSWFDELYGLQRLKAKELLGDFVVGRSYGVTAYQLAVVVDDHDSGVNHVVRGNDLIYSTFRQQAIYEAMGWQSPHWLHLPLVVGADGRRLAKRHGDTRLSRYRETGVSTESLLGELAYSVRLLDSKRKISAQELLSELRSNKHWIQQIPTENTVVDLPAVA